MNIVRTRGLRDLKNLVNTLFKLLNRNVPFPDSSSQRVGATSSLDPLSLP